MALRDMPTVILSRWCRLIWAKASGIFHCSHSTACLLPVGSPVCWGHFSLPLLSACRLLYRPIQFRHLHSFSGHSWNRDFPNWPNICTARPLQICHGVVVHVISSSRVCFMLCGPACPTCPGYLPGRFYALCSLLFRVFIKPGPVKAQNNGNFFATGTDNLCLPASMLVHYLLPWKYRPSSLPS